MKHLTDRQWYLTNALLLSVAISIFALLFAFTSQYVFGYAPCELCLYQRLPYFSVIIFGVTGLLFNRKRLGLILSSLAFFINTIIAVFHTGVEQKWWQGLSSCGGNFSADNLEEMREAIMNAPVTRCDEAAWQFIGISMAGYNVILCFALAIFTAYAFLQSKKI